MSAETFESRQLSYRSFILDGGESAEVHWEANKDQEKESNSELHKFIFILQDKRRQTILQSVDSRQCLL